MSDRPPNIADPNDLTMLRILKGSRFDPNAEVTLPSGLVITGQQAQELTADA